MKPISGFTHFPSSANSAWTKSRLAKIEEFVTDLVINRKLAKIGVILRELSRLFTRAMKHKLIGENQASGLGELYSQARPATRRLNR
jgi:alcohol dehydrogenase class IV